MNFIKVPGKKKGDVRLYALSTCIWCKKTKRLLDDLGVEYLYLDVDQLSFGEREKAEDELRKFNPRCSFPTIVVNDSKCIMGYSEDEIKETLGE